VTLHWIRERIKEKSKVRKINKIIVHCSDSLWGDAQIIDKWHKEDRGWSGIGYHFVILNGIRRYNAPYDKSIDGAIEDGRPVTEIGAHVKGHNRDSIGICLIGKEHFSATQLLVTLPDLLGRLIEEHNLMRSDVFGHRDFSTKTCPNFDVGLIQV